MKEIKSSINTYKWYNNLVFILDIILLLILVLVLTILTDINLEYILIILTISIYVPLDLIERIPFFIILKELDMLSSNSFSSDKEFNSFLFYRKIIKQNKTSSLDEIGDFIIILSYYMFIKKNNFNFKELYDTYLSMKKILNRKKWRFSKPMNNITIYNLKINDNSFLKYFLEYKYKEKEAKDEIDFLLKDKNITESILKGYKLSEEDLNYCLKRIK